MYDFRPVPGDDDFADESTSTKGDVYVLESRDMVSCCSENKGERIIIGGIWSELSAQICPSSDWKQEDNCQLVSF